MAYYWASGFIALFVGIFALDIMGLFSRKNCLDVDGKVWLGLECNADSSELTRINYRPSYSRVALLAWAVEWQRF